ncbi:MAG: hypothetical protein ACE5FM_02450 [Methyloligellaceae bacterium]
MAYRKIDPRVWQDVDFRSLSIQEQHLVFYILTAQSNRIGLFKFSTALAMEDLNLSGRFRQTFRKCFRNVLETLKWGYDERSRTLLIHSWWKYNCPPNPNVLKACLKDLEYLPETPLLQEFRENIQYLPETFHQTFREGLREGYPKQPPKQEQEQEQEQEQDITTSSAKQAATEIDNKKGAAAAGRQGGQKDQEHKDEVRSLVELWRDVGGRAEPSPQAFLDKSAETFGFKRVAKALDVLHDRPAFGGAKNQVAYFKAILEDRDNGYDSGKAGKRGKKQGERSAPSPRDEFGPTGKSVL